MWSEEEYFDIFTDAWTYLKLFLTLKFEMDLCEQITLPQKKSKMLQVIPSNFHAFQKINMSFFRLFPSCMYIYNL